MNFLTHLRWSQARNPANIVTFARLIISPIVIVGIVTSSPAWWLVVIGCLAMFSDKADGWLARRHGPTAFGGYMDSLADKVIVLGSFCALIVRGDVWWLPVALMAIREVVMSIWRTRLAARSISVPARRLGKWKAFIQALTILCFVTPGVVANVLWLCIAMVWVSVAITWISFIQYLRDSSSLHQV